ncbi:histone family DNA-binding protein [Cyclospora cayetanensis]|uniref:Histone family DNA-binding protein n=1 Tax=Cyclospora cayetanensis TaxID=88456 RepID=A0A1D3CRW3_9EIME|nr:histone family DNA-binding protein [Cyclospora cayetanensis]
MHSKQRVPIFAAAAATLVVLLQPAVEAFALGGLRPSLLTSPLTSTPLLPQGATQSSVLSGAAAAGAPVALHAVSPPAAAAAANPPEVAEEEVSAASIVDPIIPSYRQSCFCNALPFCVLPTLLIDHPSLAPFTPILVAPYPWPLLAGCLVLQSGDSITVTKKELLQRICAETGLPRTQVERVVGLLTEYINENLAKGKKVFVSRLGTFSTRRRGPRTARNPKTGDAIEAPAATFPSFSFAKSIREAVRDTIPLDTEEENEADGKPLQHFPQHAQQQHQQKKQDSKLFGWLP